MEILRKHLHNNSCRACLGSGCTYLVVTGYFPLPSTGRRELRLRGSVFEGACLCSCCSSFYIFAGWQLWGWLCLLVWPGQCSCRHALAAPNAVLVLEGDAEPAPAASKESRRFHIMHNYLIIYPWEKFLSNLWQVSVGLFPREWGFIPFMYFILLEV